MIRSSLSNVSLKYYGLGLVYVADITGHRMYSGVLSDNDDGFVTRHVRKPNFVSVSVFKNPNRSQKVKPEILVSVAFLKTELVSYK